MFTARTNLSLPKLPESVKQEIVKVALSSADVETPFLSYRSGEGIFECRNINTKTGLWCLQNLPVPFDGLAVQSVRAGNFDPHVDGPSKRGPPRNYNLMYIIDSGGDRVTTNFYKTTDQLLAQVTKDYQLPLHLCEQIESFEFLPDQWILMNNQCFHSVNGVTRTRIGLSISFYGADIPASVQKFL